MANLRTFDLNVNQMECMEAPNQPVLVPVVCWQPSDPCLWLERL